MSGIGVVHIVNGEFYAGAERVQDLLGQRLPELGYRVSFACLKRGVFQRDLCRSGNASLDASMRSRLDIVRTARAVARYARQQDCRLIHTHTARGALVGSLASALSDLPLVHHVHSPTTRDSARRWINQLNSLVEKGTLRRASALVAVSASMAGYLRARGYDAERITVVPNGVAVAETAVAGRASADELTIGAVALFRPRKGIETLLQALALVRARGCSVRLRAVGGFETPEYETSIRQLCRQLDLEGQVEWRGFQSDVAAELGRMDMLVLPSLYGEGMPMVVLEAMAVGLPVVASRVEGVPEVVRDGVDGVLVSPGDAGGLADAIGALAADPQRSAAMGVAGRQRQREEFSDRSMAERVSHVYERILRRQPVAGSDPIAVRR